MKSLAMFVVLSTWCAIACGQDMTVSNTHGVKKVYEVIGLHFDGNLRPAMLENVPDITKSSFTLFTEIESTCENSKQVIVGDWTKRWKFLFHLSGTRVCVTLRRDLYKSWASAGGHPNQDLVSGCGCKITRNKRQSVGFTWDRDTGKLSLYVDGLLCAERTTSYPEQYRDLQENSHTAWELGWKGDSRNWPFCGTIYNVCVAEGNLCVADGEHTPSECTCRNGRVMKP